MKQSLTDKIALSNVPRSTTNKAFVSLQQKEQEQSVLNSSRPSYLRSSSHSRGQSGQSLPLQQTTNSVRASQDIKSIQSQFA